MVLKFLFKATLPIVAMGGIVSYMYYLKGGDPAAVFSKITAGIAGNARSSVAQAGQSMGSLGSLKPDAKPSPISEVHKWVDANGVTHYGSNAPIDATSKTLRINPNANVVASTKRRQAEPSSSGTELNAASTDSSEDADVGLFDVKGMTVPGTGGLKMPTNLNRKELTQFLENAQRPSTER